MRRRCARRKGAGLQKSEFAVFTIFLPALAESGPAPGGCGLGNVICGSSSRGCAGLVMPLRRAAGARRLALALRRRAHAGCCAARPGRTGAVPLGRHGRILNQAFPRRFCRLLRGGGAASLRWPRQPVIHRSEGEFAVAEIFLPALTESGKAFDRMRSCVLRFAAAFGQPCGFMAARVQGAGRAGGGVCAAGRGGPGCELPRRPS